jgi:beta-galactosidase
MLDRFHLGVCYYPEHWPASKHADDFARMRENGFDLVRLGEGAWSYFEPEEGKFRFDLFDRAIDLCRKNGLKVIFGTPTYCGPAWIASNYPEVLRWNFQRIPMRHGSRRNFNYTSPKYLELSDRICTALAEHYAKEKQIVAWQLDNEFNCHMDVSYAPSDTIAFRKWLREKYRTLEKLKHAWGTAFWSQTYGDWDQIDLAHPTSAPPNPTQILDESRFISDRVVRFAARQARILRKYNKKWLITHNALFNNVNGPELVKQLDFFSHDQYPLFSEDWPARADALVQARSLSFPFGILEQQSGPGGQSTYLQRTPRPGEIRLWAWQAVAHGARFVSFFLWRTCPFGAEQHWHGLLDQDNKKGRRLAEARAFGEEARRLPGDFHSSGKMNIAAILRDYDNEINERRINTYNKSGEAEHARWLRAFALQHVPADYVWSGGKIDRHRVLVVPHLQIVTRELANELTEHVEEGGVLVLGAQCGLMDVNCHIVQKTPPGLLAKLAGVEVEDWSTLGAKEVRVARIGAGPEMTFTTFVERLRPTTASVCARWNPGDPLLANAPAITSHKLGKGVVYYIGGYLPTESIEIFVQEFLLGSSVWGRADASGEVELIYRRGRKDYYVVALNHSSSPQRVSFQKGSKDLLTGKAADPHLILGGFAVAVVRLGK